MDSEYLLLALHSTSRSLSGVYSFSVENRAQHLQRGTVARSRQVSLDVKVPLLM